MVLVPRSLYFHQSDKSQTWGKGQQLYYESGHMNSSEEETIFIWKNVLIWIARKVDTDLKSWMSVGSGENNERTIPESRERGRAHQGSRFWSFFTGVKNCRSWRVQCSFWHCMHFPDVNSLYLLLPLPPPPNLVVNTEISFYKLAFGWNSRKWSNFSLGPTCYETDYETLTQMRQSRSLKPAVAVSTWEFWKSYWEFENLRLPPGMELEV